RVGDSGVDHRQPGFATRCSRHAVGRKHEDAEHAAQPGQSQPVDSRWSVGSYRSTYGTAATAAGPEAEYKSAAATEPAGECVGFHPRRQQEAEIVSSWAVGADCPLLSLLRSYLRVDHQRRV